MKKFGSRLALSVSVLSFAAAIASPAMAQDAAVADEAESADSQEIVVTGSLIQRPNNTAVSPIVTVGEAAITVDNVRVVFGNAPAAVGVVTARGVEAPRYARAA